MGDHPNLDVLKATLNAFQSGDIPTLTKLFSPDVVWTVPGRSFLAKEYRGHEEVFGLFGSLMKRTGGTFRAESLDMLANDKGGVFVDRLTAEREGKKLDVRVALHVAIRDGVIVEGVDHFHQEHLWDAFWA